MTFFPKTFLAATPGAGRERANLTARRGRARGLKVYSGRKWRRARLRVGACGARRYVRRLVLPNNARRFAIGSRKGYLRGCIDRGAGACKATDGASIAVLTVLAALIGGLIRGNAAALADLGGAQRVRSRNGSRPGRTYRSKDLHQQSDEEDRQIFLKSRPHLNCPKRWATNHVVTQESSAMMKIGAEECHVDLRSITPITVRTGADSHPDLGASNCAVRTHGFLNGLRSGRFFATPVFPLSRSDRDNSQQRSAQSMIMRRLTPDRRSRREARQNRWVLSKAPRRRPRSPFSWCCHRHRP